MRQGEMLAITKINTYSKASLVAMDTVMKYDE